MLLYRLRLLLLLLDLLLLLLLAPRLRPLLLCRYSGHRRSGWSSTGRRCRLDGGYGAPRLPGRFALCRLRLLEGGAVLFFLVAAHAAVVVVSCATTKAADKAAVPDVNLDFMGVELTLAEEPLLAMVATMWLQMILNMFPLLVQVQA